MTTTPSPPGGGWSLFHDGKFDISASIKAYYALKMIGGGVATGFDPAVKKDGTVLDAGYIGLQAESQPVEFRNIRLLNLSGCMNPESRAYRPYFVHRDDSRCSGQ